MTIDEEVEALTAERDAKLAALGPEPRWWRPFARRRWRHRRDGIMATDIRWTNVWLRRMYSRDVVAELAERKNPYMAFCKKKVGSL